jgi:hypothetical protein
MSAMSPHSGAGLTAKEPSRDMIYMLRTVQQHQVQLSNLADSKANTLISTSFVVLALVVGQMKASGFSLPLVIIAATTLLCACFAVLAVLPRGVADRPSPEAREFNPLFFGHFANLELEDFVSRIEAIGTDSRGVHAAMARDIYSIGRLLHDKKYRYLRYSYRIFLTGLLATLLGLVYTYVIH